MAGKKLRFRFRSQEHYDFMSLCPVIGSRSCERKWQSTHESNVDDHVQ